MKKAEFEGTPERTGLSDRGRLIGARLRKLRRERRLIEKAILALSEISQNRNSRFRRASRRFSA